MIAQAAYDQWGQHGVPVFPCAPSKAPLTANGFKDAETELHKIVHLFGDRDDTLIGAAMGEQCGLFAIDFDFYKGEHVRRQLETWKAQGLLPPTRVHRTVRGGEHWIYFFPEDAPAPRNSNPIPGIDIRGEGGYIIVPPSTGYEVVTSETAEAPAALISMLAEAVTKFKSNSTSDLESKILSGESFHESLLLVSARLSARGLPTDQVAKRLNDLMAASQASNPAHDRHERWKYLVNSNEVSRMVATGTQKFNPNAKSDRLADSLIAKGKTSVKPTPAKTSETDEHFANADRLGALLKHKNFAQEEARESTDDPFPIERSYNAASADAWDDGAYLIYPLIQRGDTVVLSADPKAGKTMLTLTLAMCVASGEEIVPEKLYPLDRDGTRGSQSVLYFALESQGAIRRRIKAWTGQFEDDFTEDDMFLHVVEEATNLADPLVRARVVQKIVQVNEWLERRQRPPLSMIVFDTLTKAMPGRDQNSVDDTSEVFNIVDDVKAMELDAAIIFVHHNNRAGGMPRGSSNIMAEPDSVLSVEKMERVQVGDDITAGLKLKVYMARSVDDEQEYGFAFKTSVLGKNRQGIEIEAPYLVPVDTVEEVTKLEEQVKDAMGRLDKLIEDWIMAAHDTIYPRQFLVAIEAKDKAAHLALKYQLRSYDGSNELYSFEQYLEDWWRDNKQDEHGLQLEQLQPRREYNYGYELVPVESAADDAPSGT